MIESISLGLFFLLFYPIELGIPMFITLTIIFVGAIYLFIFILKIKFDVLCDKERLKQKKLKKLQNKIKKLNEQK